MVAWIAVAGAAGTLARYGLQGVSQRLIGGGFPWGTLVVNALGCLLFGVVWALAEERLVISGQTRSVLLIGFMGGFTTFSSYAFESGQLARDAQWLLALANVAGQPMLGLLMVWIGWTLGRNL
jgi:CrcB protein